MAGLISSEHSSVCVPALIRQMKQQVRSRRIRHQGRWQCCVSMAGAAWAPHRYTILLALPGGATMWLNALEYFLGIYVEGESAKAFDRC